MIQLITHSQERPPQLLRPHIHGSDFLSGCSYIS